jgi:transcriptional regulator with PAS, ATPase and Fis domain
LPESLRPPAALDASTARIDTLRDLEAHFITQALQRHNWNRLATAKTLGIHKTTLWRKMKDLGILPPQP